MSDLSEMLFAAFQVEHKQHLGGIRAILVKMEQGDGTVSRPDLDELFRCAHSLKAAARACDFHFIETISQRLEMLFSQIRKSGSPPRQEVFGAIRDALTAIEDWTLGLTEKRTPPEPRDAVEALDRVLGSVPRTNPSPVVDELGAKLLAAFQIEHKEHLEAIRSFLAEIEQGGFPGPAKVDEAFRRAHSLKGAARLAELPSTEELADRLENVFARVREGTLSLKREAIRAIGLGLDAVEDDAAALVNKRPPPDTTGARKAIDQILEKSPGRRPLSAENASVPERTDPAVPTTATTETVRVSAENLDRLLRSTGQLLSESLRQKMVARELNELDREIDGLEREWARTIGGITPALQQMATTPELSRVNRSINVVEKQIRALRRRGRAVRRLQQSSSWNLTLLGGQIQQDVRRVRTVSAETVFQGFRKMMRDLARDEGKEIDFRINGLEIEADRMVLQALKDPLMHVLRNAVSHGLEPPDERRRLGKDSVGHVTLHLEIVGSRLTIRVEEDGRGIDFAKVAAVAVSRSFLTEAEAATASQAELASLLFAAGFSTARQVTGLSGRGMGLSVVSEAAARLQGEVELRPRPEYGTIFILSVPLTISTQRLLLVSCHLQTFAIPLHSIERLLRIKLQEIEMVEGRPTLILQGQSLPVLSLASLLELSQTDVEVEGDSLSVVILRSGSKRTAAIVDGFLEEREALIHELDKPVAHLSKLAGGIFLEDGSVSLVLNVADVIRTFKSTDRTPIVRRTQVQPEKKRSTVLVVDDSLTTRTLEKSILETHGYDVRIAMDGVEALAQLQLETVDLVITDVQMPHMDGFQLLEEMKKNTRFAQIPVIVVTSMSSREDQERGLGLGADAYIVKRKFDHDELLKTIRQII